MPMNVNIPGVMAGGLDFSNIARSINTMVQGIAGRLIPGATLVNPTQTPPTGQTANVPSQSNVTANTAAASSNTNEPSDRVTEQMLGGAKKC